jgi:hypothetical protein
MIHRMTPERLLISWCGSKAMGQRLFHHIKALKSGKRKRDLAVVATRSEAKRKRLFAARSVSHARQPPDVQHEEGEMDGGLDFSGLEFLG